LNLSVNEAGATFYGVISDSDSELEKVVAKVLVSDTRDYDKLFEESQTLWS